MTLSSISQPPSIQSVAEMHERGCGRRQRGPDGPRHFERKPHPVLETAAVFVGTEIRQRRQERLQEIAMRHVKLDDIKARQYGPASRGDERVAHAAQPFLAQGNRGLKAVGERDIRRSGRHPAFPRPFQYRDPSGGCCP